VTSGKKITLFILINLKVCVFIIYIYLLIFFIFVLFCFCPFVIYSGKKQNPKGHGSTLEETRLNPAISNAITSTKLESS